MAAVITMQISMEAFIIPESIQEKRQNREAADSSRRQRILRRGARSRRRKASVYRHRRSRTVAQNVPAT